MVEFKNKQFLLKSFHPNHELQFLNDWFKNKFILGFSFQNFSSQKEIFYIIKEDHQELILKSIDELGNFRKTFKIINPKIIVKIERFETYEVFSAQISFESIAEVK